MSEKAEPVEIARFSSRLEAEAIGHALDAHGIPFLVQSHDIGMFGPGHTGSTPSGAALLVPSDRVDEVRHLLDCLVKEVPAEDDAEPEPEAENP